VTFSSVPRYGGKFGIKLYTNYEICGSDLHVLNIKFGAHNSAKLKRSKPDLDLVD